MNNGGQSKTLEKNFPFAFKEVSDISRRKEPIAVVKAKGKKHLTKAEIEERESREPKLECVNVRAPDYLLKKQRDKFYEIADKLISLGMTELDVDCLANFITAQDLYQSCSKKIRILLSNGKVDKDLQMQQDRAFKQAYQWARELGLTISSRCAIEIPKVVEDDDTL